MSDLVGDDGNDGMCHVYAFAESSKEPFEAVRGGEN